MKREISIILCMLMAFGMTAWLIDSPTWFALLVAILAGMWADLRMGR